MIWKKRSRPDPAGRVGAGRRWWCSCRSSLTWLPRFRQMGSVAPARVPSRPSRSVPDVACPRAPTTPTRPRAVGDVRRRGRGHRHRAVGDRPGRSRWCCTTGSPTTAAATGCGSRRPACSSAWSGCGTYAGARSRAGCVTPGFDRPDLRVIGGQPETRPIRGPWLLRNASVGRHRGAPRKGTPPHEQRNCRRPLRSPHRLPQPPARHRLRRRLPAGRPPRLRLHRVQQLRRHEHRRQDPRHLRGEPAAQHRPPADRRPAAASPPARACPRPRAPTPWSARSTCCWASSGCSSSTATPTSCR